MTLPVSGKAYRFRCGNTARYLNLYSSGAAANGMNVVLYSGDSSKEQQWRFDGSLLRPGTDPAFALDKYTLASHPNHNNADIWAANDPANQALAFEAADNGRVRVRLTGSGLYLTACGDANGSAGGKTPFSSGNVLWAASNPANHLQQWTPEEVAAPSGGFCWPTESARVTQEFTGGHLGIDIGTKVVGVDGDKVFAYMPGVVSMTGTPAGNPKEGYTLRIHHVNPLSNGYAQLRTQYMHLKGPALPAPREAVAAGQLLGYMGSTGNSTGNHLHFEVRVSDTEFPLGDASSYATGIPVNPRPYLDLANKK